MAAVRRHGAVQRDVAIIDTIADSALRELRGCRYARGHHATFTPADYCSHVASA